MSSNAAAAPGHGALGHDPSRPPSTVPVRQVIGLVAGATIVDLLRRRRLVFLGLVVAFPVLLTLAWRIWGQRAATSAGMPELLTATGFFTNMVRELYLRVLVLLAGLAFGLPTINDEVEGRTITYLLTRPIGREPVYWGRLMAVQLTAGGLLAISLMGCFAIMVVGNFSVLSFDFVKLYVNHVLVVLLAAVSYCAIFALIGTAFVRPLVWGILYAFGWEFIASRLPGRITYWTLDSHLRNLLVGKEASADSLIDSLRHLIAPQQGLAPAVSLLVLGIAIAGLMVAGGAVFARKEYVVT